MNKDTKLHMQASGSRISSIDSLRGLVMVLMTLDHTRDFFSNAHFSPTDLDQTSVALFMTRWITHFCAPVFVFLAGAGSYLWWLQRGTEAAISTFLVKRGLIILALTATVEALAWNFHHDFRQIDGGVLWAIAWSMLVLAGLVKLPLSCIIAFGSGMIIGHNSLDSLSASELGWFGPWWSVLHTGAKIRLADGWLLHPYYPLIPWLGVMAIGFGFGKWLSIPHWRSPARLFSLAITLMGAFIILRYSNQYGDPKPWQAYPKPEFTLLSFLNCHKYPPSLLYILMTLGPALVVLALFEALPRLGPAFLGLFGRTPLFFYLLHLYLIHLLALTVAWADDGPVSALMTGGIWVAELPQDYGYSLPIVYLLWLSVLALLYPLCRSFEQLKISKPEWSWLNYL